MTEAVDLLLRASDAAEIDLVHLLDKNIDVPNKMEDMPTDPKLMAQQLLSMHNETVTSSHLQWLERQCAKMLQQYAELCQLQNSLSEQTKALDVRPKQKFTANNKRRNEY